jgi:hypothetical protein
MLYTLPFAKGAKDGAPGFWWLGEENRQRQRQQQVLRLRRRMTIEKQRQQRIPAG